MNLEVISLLFFGFFLEEFENWYSFFFIHLVEDTKVWIFVCCEDFDYSFNFLTSN